MPVDQVEIGNAARDQLTVTLRGDPAALLQALVNGLDRASLVALKDALEAELAARKAVE